MKIVVNGRKVGNGHEACYDYDNYTAYFTRRGLNKSDILHELYHYLAYVSDWDMSERKEERHASRFVEAVLKKARG